LSTFIRALIDNGRIDEPIGFVSGFKTITLDCERQLFSLNWFQTNQPFAQGKLRTSIQNCERHVNEAQIIQKMNFYLPLAGSRVSTVDV
jgi:hypothetical protein